MAQARLKFKSEQHKNILIKPIALRIRLNDHTMFDFELN